MNTRVQTTLIAAVAAVIWGLAYLAFDLGHSARYGWLSYDEAVYLRLAEQPFWSVGPYRPPLVWTLLKIAGTGGFQILNLAAVGAMCGALYAAAHRFGGWRAGLLAAALPLTLPTFWKHSWRFMPETLALAAVSLALWAIPARRFWVAGAALGIGALGRPEVAGLAALSLLTLPTRHRRWALVAVAALVVVLPFTLRNAVASGRFVPISANAGTNLWLGNLRERWLKGHTLKAKYPAQVAALRAVSHDVDRDRLRVRFFLRHARENPGRVWELWRFKAEHFWFGNSYWGHPTSISHPMRVYVMVAYVGIILGLTRRPLRLPALLAAGLILFMWAVAIVVFPMERLRVFILPGVALAVALCPVAIAQVVAAERASHPCTPATPQTGGRRPAAKLAQRTHTRRSP